AADAACLTALDRERLAAQARSIARLAYRRGAEELLDRIEAADLREDAVQRDLLLGRAERLMRKLKRLKLESAAYDGLSSRLARLRRAEPVAGPQPAIGRRALVGERRLFPRYREPQLTVQLGRQFARTVN